jgi:hypothetical protein
MKYAADYLSSEAIERAFALKRANFVTDYKLEQRPTLIWQCMPTEPITMDVNNQQIRQVLQNGAGAVSDAGWWCAFNAGRRPAFVFDGLASSAGSDGWTSEIHVDGHFQAGVWNFPDLSTTSDNPGTGVADFYAEAFRDFGFVASKVFEAANYTGETLVTCTMLQSNQLPFIGNGRVLAPAVNRSELRWPVLAQSTADIGAACSVMAGQFMRAYGLSAPRSYQ